MKMIDEDKLELLVEAAKSGDQASWTELFDIAYRGMHFIAMDFMKDPDRAQDAEQEASIRVFKGIGSLNEPKRFLAWTRQITANTCKNMLKKHSEFTFSDVEEASGLADEDMSIEIEDVNVEFKPEDQMDIKETARLIREMMEELPDEQRVVLDLLYGSEMSVKEIAEAMECSENTVKSRLRYGRNAMEEKVEALRKKGTKLYLIPIAVLIRTALHSEMEVNVKSRVP